MSADAFDVTGPLLWEDPRWAPGDPELRNHQPREQADGTWRCWLCGTVESRYHDFVLAARSCLDVRARSGVPRESLR